MKAFYSDTFVLPLPETHRFPMRKYSRLRERLVDEHILSPDDVRVAPAADWDDIRLVHTGAYVDAVANGSLDGDLQRRIGFPWSPEMVERSRRSVGATLAAARAARLDGVAANPQAARTTPSAIAAKATVFSTSGHRRSELSARERRPSRGHHRLRRASRQWDSMFIFQRDHTVFTFSMHGAHNFPFRKR